MATICFSIEHNDHLHFQYGQCATSRQVVEFVAEHPACKTLELPLLSACTAKQALTEIARVLWKELGDIPVDDDGFLEEPFYTFLPGTHREEIWHWFESETKMAVYDLMFPETANK